MKTLGNVTLFNFPTADKAVVSQSSMTYKAKLVYEDGSPISSADLSALTLSLIDAKSGAIINGVSNINILNTDRGTIDIQGNLAVVLTPDDTFSELNTIDRSMIFRWVYGVDNLVGRHQIVFRIVKLSGDA